VVTSPANPASPNPAKQSEDLVMELQRKLAATENMLRATQEQAGYQRELLTLHKEQIADYREKVIDLSEQQHLQENIIFSMQQQAQAEPPKPSKFARLEDPQNAKRLEYLVGKGYTVAEAMQALEDTRSPDGNFSSMRAETHLKANAEAEQADVVRRANALNGDSAIPEILPNSAVAHLLTQHEDAVDMVTKLREVHAKSRLKNMHNGKTALSAACLVEVPSVKTDGSLLRKGLNFLCQVASAVSEDCGKCKELRDQLEQEARWAKEKEKAAALKARTSKSASASWPKQPKRRRDNARCSRTSSTSKSATASATSPCPAGSAGNATKVQPTKPTRGCTIAATATKDTTCSAPSSRSSATVALSTLPAADASTTSTRSCVKATRRRSR
jgi:hypothetical protein